MTDLELRATIQIRAEETAEVCDETFTERGVSTEGRTVRELLRQRNALKAMVERLLPEVGNANASALGAVNDANTLLDEIRG